MKQHYSEFTCLNVFSFLKDVAVLRFESAGGQNEELYHQLFNYLHSLDWCGVVSGCSGSTMKDMYIVPVESGHGLPSVLLPSDGPGNKNQCLPVAY